ncbi:MAG: glycosyltransferase [Bacteroidales bacterium]|nr:glycosyltransferase [Bacteroidales bacterium]MBR4625640.1 glycosyltransferase [Alphaproteobacteria bacterium]
MSLSNIIIVCDFGYIEGGASKVAITSAVHLSNLYNVTFFCGSAVTDETIKNSNLKVVSINNSDILHDSNRLRAFRNGLWNKNAYQSLNDLLEKYSPTDTIVHVHSYTKILSPSIFKVLSKHVHNVVITLHDYFQICANGGLFNYKELTKCHIKPQSFRCIMCNCDSRKYIHKLWRCVRLTIQQKNVKNIKNLNFVYISKLNQQLLSPYLDTISQSSRIIKNPIDINIKHLADVKNNSAYIYMGRICEEKGVRLFCEVIHSLKLNAIVIGDGPCKQELEKKYPDIQFVGWKTGLEKEKYLYQGKCLVFPSLWYEGAPLTIVEAKSYGLPCIVADDCAATEDIIEGEEGYIFESGSIESLKEAIIKMESSNENVLQGNIIKQFNVELYKMERYTKEVVEYYHSLLNG